MLGVLFLKVFKVKNLILKGLVFGISGYVLGVVVGIEMGEVEVVMVSIVVVIVGVVIVVVILFFV